MSERNVKTGIEVKGNVDLIAHIETLKKNQLTEFEKKVFNQLYMFDLDKSIEALQHIHDVAVYHSDVDCWDDQKKFLQELYFFKELIDAIKKLPNFDEPGLGFYDKYHQSN